MWRASSTRDEERRNPAGGRSRQRGRSFTLIRCAARATASMSVAADARLSGSTARPTARSARPCPCPAATQQRLVARRMHAPCRRSRAGSSTSDSRSSHSGTVRPGCRRGSRRSSRRGDRQRPHDAHRLQQCDAPHHLTLLPCPAASHCHSRDGQIRSSTTPATGRPAGLSPRKSPPEAICHGGSPPPRRLRNGSPRAPPHKCVRPVNVGRSGAAGGVGGGYVRWRDLGSSGGRSEARSNSARWVATQAILGARVRKAPQPALLGMP